VWSLTFVKISVACLFVRIQRTGPNAKLWNWGMALSIVSLLVAAVVATALQLTECLPLNKLWDPLVLGGKCRSAKEVQMSIIGSSGMFEFQR
jgi:hypothetical protein